MIDPSTQCPCGSGAAYSACCSPYHHGKAWPESPEKLMRSRYSAFATGAIPWLVESVDPSRRSTVEEREVREWSEGSEWLGLQILGEEGGGPGESEGTVEFEAHYRLRESGEDVHHHEVATFRRREGRWYFLDGKVRGLEPIHRDAPRIGRNDPCPCGSGKKHKKCCGKE